MPRLRDLPAGPSWGGRRRRQAVAERMRAEVALRASEERFRGLVAAAPDPILGVDPEGRIAFASDHVMGTFGWLPEDLVGRHVDVLVPGALTAGPGGGAERTALRRDGTEVPVEVSLGAPAPGPGALTTLVVVDVTARRRLERRLAQAERLEAVGRLAGGVAHDFNNLLTVMTGFAELARMRIGDGPGSDELEEVGRAAERATRLTAQLLAFSRRQVLDPVELDLGALVADLEPMLRQLVPAGIALCLETAPDVPPVHADRAQLEQVVVNLVANARDALAGGGTIAVRVEADELDDGAADAAGVAPGAYVRLVVADTGPGVDPAVLGTLFEPFVSTKEAGHGTGLGLATVHGIVVQSGGAVRVLSEPGRGATFFVHLPVARHAAPAPAPAAAAPAPAPPAPRGHERVLVCEDEAAVRRLLEIVLTGHGYAVRTAAHPGEALALLEAGTPLDLLVSDVVMPGMSGLELASRVRAQRPGVPVLFLSGYTASEFDGELPQRSGFMEKPFEPGALLTSVRTLLDEGPGEGRGARHRFRGRGAPRRQESRAP